MTSLLPLDLPYPAWLPSSFGDTEKRERYK